MSPEQIAAHNEDVRTRTERNMQRFGIPKGIGHPPHTPAVAAPLHLCDDGCDVGYCQDCGEDYTEPCERHQAPGHRQAVEGCQDQSCRQEGQGVAEGEPTMTDPPFTTEHLLAGLRHEADLVVKRGVVTTGQRLVICDLLIQAADEIARLLEHSVILNRAAWRLHEAMGVIPEGATEYFGDIEGDLDAICAAVRRGMNEASDVLGTTILPGTRVTHRSQFGPPGTVVCTYGNWVAVMWDEYPADHAPTLHRAFDVRATCTASPEVSDE